MASSPASGRSGATIPAAAAPRAATIRRADRDGPLPLSFAQQQIWLHAQLAPSVPLYNEPLTVRHRGVLDPAALAEALAGIVARHEAWRTVFRATDERPVQVVLPPGAVDLPAHDLRARPRAAREGEARALAAADARRPFDLTAGPLLRARLVQVDDDDARLYLTLHHIVFDGYSLYQVLVPELAALYQAAVHGTRAVLPPPAVDYGDWAMWQRAEVERGAFARQLDYWTKQLDDAPAPAELGDRPRPAAQSYRGDTHVFALPRALAERLRQLSRDERASLFMTLAAGFLALVHRHAGQDDLVIGSVSAGRKRPELARVLGFFANPVALRVALGDDPPFRTLLRRVRDTALDALANDDVPFEHIVARLRPARDPARHPFFQTVFSLEAPMAALPDGWDVRHTDVSTGTSKFDLYLEMNDRPDGLGGRIVYATDLFEPATVARLARHYETLLAAAAQEPATRVSALHMLDEGERRQVLVDFAQSPATAWPARATVHGLVAEHALRTPDAVALVEGERRLTYAGLDARAATLARRLTAAGVTHGSVVATYAERSIELIVGYLAVLRAGGAYLPLDPGHPRERLVAMLEDAGVHVLLTTRRHQRLALSGVTTLALLDEPVGPVGAAPAARVQPDDRAYVMFTSGSTGRPKGVAVPHRAIVRLVFGQRYARFGPAERVLHLARPVFDASTFEIWGALLHGGACVIHPPGVPTPATLRAIIGRSGATTALFTTSLFNTIVDEDPEALRGLTQIGIGGEPLSPQHAARAAAALPGVELFNGYGPTETTTFAACHPIPRPIDAGAGSVPIGRPIAGAEAYVLDAHGTPVPAGVPGELYIGGTGLAHGYINRPDLTAERFVPHPFRADPGARLYRTGDVVRWRADGLLEFIGRRDGQVKIRGVRVELGEVEAALRADPRVRDAAVVAVETAAGERRLVAYVVPAGPPPRATALRAALLDRLPAAFVPAAFVALDALPLTPNGKLDRNALPAPAASRPSPTAPARGPLKRQLAAVWAELLGVEEVGAHDDFFDLGGHSLLAVRMLQRVQQLYGIALPLAVLYGDPTIDGVAAALLRHDAEAPPAPIVKLRDGDDRAPLFFFHGDLNGGGFYCRKLARHLRPGRTVWVVHPLGVDHARVPLSIEAMARQHVRDLTALAPDGPLVLGGYCNGGLVAWEAARLLAAEGRVVERVILIAADADTRFSRLRAPLIRAARLLGLGDGLADVQFGRVRAFASRVRARSPRGRVALAVRSAMHVTRQVAQQLRRHRPRPLAAGPLGRRYFDLVTSYVPPPWPGHAVVFWPAAEEPARRDDPTAGWGALAGRVDVHPIPGDHDEIVTRHIEEVAVLLGRYL